MDLPPLPLKNSLLERYRLSGRRKLRPDMLGGHLVRRKGQSLDFREFEHYLPGDDIRHIDWRASARYGQINDLLVRSFVAEEQLTLVISIDTRDTMQLPAVMPKLQIAAWLAEAIARVALSSGDRVILHRLFGPPKRSVFSLRGVNARGRIRPALTSLCSELATDDCNVKVLQKWMPPTAVWLILSDLYFQAEYQQRVLARSIVNALDGLRWLILLDLDSWPAERQLLGMGARRVVGPGLQVVDPLYQIDPANLALVENKISHHKRHFLQQSHAARFDQVTWTWPHLPQPVATTYFKEAFLGDACLQRLFMRDKA